MAPKKQPAKAAKKKARNTSAAEGRFIDDLVTLGQAVEKKSPDQKLPPGATHWLVVDAATGERRVERARFSLG